MKGKNAKLSRNEELRLNILRLTLKIMESGDKEKIEKLFNYFSGLYPDIAKERR